MDTNLAVEAIRGGPVSLLSGGTEKRSVRIIKEGVPAE